MNFFTDYMIWIVLGCMMLYTFVAAVEFGLSWLKDRRRVKYVKEVIPYATKQFTYMSLEMTKQINQELYKSFGGEEP